MINPPADASELVRIRSSMRKWLKMDEAGSLVGRGLGRRELIERVALDVGATLTAVKAALRSARD